MTVDARKKTVGTDRHGGIVNSAGWRVDACRSGSGPGCAAGDDCHSRGVAEPRPGLASSLLLAMQIVIAARGSVAKAPLSPRNDRDDNKKNMTP